MSMWSTDGLTTGIVSWRSRAAISDHVSAEPQPSWHLHKMPFVVRRSGLRQQSKRVEKKRELSQPWPTPWSRERLVDEPSRFEFRSAARIWGAGPSRESSFTSCPFWTQAFMIFSRRTSQGYGQCQIKPIFIRAYSFLVSILELQMKS